MFSNLCSLSEPQFKMYPNYYMYIYFCLFVYNIAALIDKNSVMSGALFYYHSRTRAQPNETLKIYQWKNKNKVCLQGPLFSNFGIYKDPLAISYTTPKAQVTEVWYVGFKKNLKPMLPRTPSRKQKESSKNGINYL